MFHDEALQPWRKIVRTVLDVRFSLGKGHALDQVALSG